MRTKLARKGAGELFDAFLQVDLTWRELLGRVERLRAATKPKGRPSPEEIITLAAQKEELRQLELELETIAQERSRALAQVPNPPDESAPDGSTEEDAIEIRRVNEPVAFHFPVRDHLDLGGFDPERGARLSGSRFAYRIGPTALVELALYRYALDLLVSRGFCPVLPPVLVREEAMYGTGFLPTDEINIYRVESDDLYLTGTSEVALAGLHMGEILSEEDLPLRYAGYSTCFRREAGSAGRDTRGIFRVHQFDKVEMFVYTTPEGSLSIHEEILAMEEEIVAGLGLAYRVINTAAGDLGPSAAKKFDIEAYIPSQDRYREITSCSNTTDFQTRRLNTRYRAGGELRFPHTLNGTAMTARFLVAILETFQDEGGSVAIPEILVRHGAPSRIEPTHS
jgi:seryl-tRNA synthetase